METSQPESSLLSQPEEPDWHVHSLEQLNSIAANYGLKKHTDRDKLISLLKSMWNRLHPSSVVEDDNMSRVKSIASSTNLLSAVGDVVNADDNDSNICNDLDDGDDNNDNNDNNTPLTEPPTQEHITVDTTMSKSVNTTEDLLHFIRNDSLLYERVLSFEPIDLDSLYLSLQTTRRLGGELTNKGRVLQILDDEGIFVTTSQSGNRNHHFAKEQLKKKKNRELIGRNLGH